MIPGSKQHVIIPEKEVIIINTLTQETAIQAEQRLDLKQEIINDIINILAKNQLSIAEAKDVLYATSKEICKQTVKSFS